MPLYEYECKKCHHRFEKIQKFSDAHIKKCPKCGGPVEQLISAPTVHFKGSGFYVTDYPKNPSGASSSSDADSASKSDSAAKSDSAKGDSASKKESKPKSESKSESKKSEKK